MIVIRARERKVDYLLYDAEYSDAFGGTLTAHFGQVGDESVAQAGLAASFRLSQLSEIELLEVVEQIELPVAA